MNGSWTLAFYVEAEGWQDRVVIKLDIGTAPSRTSASSSAIDLELLATLYLNPASKPPPSPGNRFADHPGAARLGKKLFSTNP